jgi:hypothetical protein
MARDDLSVLSAFLAAAEGRSFTLPETVGAFAFRDEPPPFAGSRKGSASACSPEQHGALRRQKLERNSLRACALFSQKCVTHWTRFPGFAKSRRAAYVCSCRALPSHS